MNRLKKLYSSIVLVLFIAPLLVACGGDSATATKLATTVAATTIATTTAAATTKADTTVAATTAAATTKADTTVAATTAAATTKATTSAATTQAAVATTAATAAPLAKLTFQPFTSQAGKFSVAFPGKPEVVDKDFDVDGQKATSHTFYVNVNGNEATYIVDYAEIPASTVKRLGAETILDRAIKDKVSIGKVTSQLNLNLGDYPTRDTKFTDGKYDYTDRLYMVGNTLYELLVTYPTGKSPASDIKTFLNSFQLADEVTATAPTAASKATDDTVEVKLDQVFYDSLAGQFKGVASPAISFYSSDNDPATLAKALDAEAVQNGYKFAQPGATGPVKQGNQFIGIYTKAGQSDLLFSVTDAPTKAADVKALWPSLDETANQAAVTKMLNQYKGKKTIGVLVVGAGVVDSLNGTSSRTDSTPTAATDLSKNLQEVKVDGVLNDALAKSFPGVTGFSVKMYTSGLTAPDVTTQIDAALKAEGYTFAIPGATTPVKQDLTFIGLYSKAGQPDILINTLDVPTDAATRLKAFTQLGLPDATAQSYADLFKDKKSGMFVMSGDNLVSVVLKK